MLGFKGILNINNNAAELPTALGGTVLQIAAMDGTYTRILTESFGTNAATLFSMRRARGTAAAPQQYNLMML